MKRYVDGYVLPVPKKNIKAYQKIARACGKIWMEHGALQYVESVAEDMTKHPFCMSFSDIVQPKRGETMIFAFIMFKSRKHRDSVNKKAMEDPRLQPDKKTPMPFDCKRMAWNGFETIVNL